MWNKNGFLYQKEKGWIKMEVAVIPRDSQQQFINYEESAETWPWIHEICEIQGGDVKTR